MKFIILLLATFSSGAVFAHTGHAQHASALLSGLLHPLSGLDHLLLALGLGVLLARAASLTTRVQTAPWLGVVGLGLSLLIGFALGVQQLVSATLTEYGIVASLLALSVALWRQRPAVALAGISVLGLFHGVAHGLEVPVGQSALLFFAGMLISMAALYAVGVLLGTALQHWAKQGSTIAARLLAVLTVGVVVLG